MAFFPFFKQGQIYLNTWPQEAKLGLFSLKTSIMKAPSFAQKFMPLLLYLQYCGNRFMQKNDLMAFSIAILTTHFLPCLFLSRALLAW